MKRLWVAILGALAVAVAVALLAVPTTLARWWLSPDAIEHLAIANAWVHGSGFVDPVQWYFYLTTDVPLPAFAVRAPLVPFLLAIPFSLGATLSNVNFIHALWASIIAGAMVLAARRFMRLPAAVGSALFLGLSPGWLFIARFAWTEVTALGAYLLVLVTSRGALRSFPGALLCAISTLLAFLTRPNLGALVIAVIVACFIETGPRKALRNHSLRAYAITFCLLYLIVNLVITLRTGLPLYAGYGVLGEIFSSLDTAYYQKEFIGTWAFIQLNSAQILERMGTRIIQLYQILCLDSKFHYVGWLLPPAILYGLLSRAPGAMERRITALSALGFSVIVISTYGSFDANRFPLLIAASGTLCAFSMFDDMIIKIQRRLANRCPSIFHLLPPLLPLIFSLTFIAVTTGAMSTRFAQLQWSYYKKSGTVEFASLRDGNVRALCRHMDKNAIVAAPFPWAFSLWCGNAALTLPVDLSTPEWQAKFIAEKTPRYLVSDGKPVYHWLKWASGIRLIARSGPLTVYEVVNPSPEIRPWNAPPPLACAGKGPECAEAVGR